MDNTNRVLTTILLTALLSIGLLGLGFYRELNKLAVAGAQHIAQLAQENQRVPNPQPEPEAEAPCPEPPSER